MRNYLLFVFLILVLSIGVLYQSNPTENTIKTIDKALEWNNTRFSPPSDDTLTKIVYKILDTTGFVMFETAKVILHWVKDNPWINFKLLLVLTVLALCSMFIVPIVKLIMLTYVFIKDMIETRREKREFKELKGRVK